MGKGDWQAIGGIALALAIIFGRQLELRHFHFPAYTQIIYLHQFGFNSSYQPSNMFYKHYLKKKGEG